MSDADRLREAARMLRERAEAATPGPWQHLGDHLVWPSEKGPAANDPIAGISEAHEECAAYIATVSPPFALAVADWLDDLARWSESGDAGGRNLDHALAVADAVLGADRGNPDSHEWLGMDR
jgi:hypothetical protein